MRRYCSSKSILFLFAALSLTFAAFAQENATGAASAPPAELITPEIIENPEVKLLDSEGAGKLYQVGEHVVCVMEGTPEEMGYQHGRLLAQKIRHIIKEGYLPKALWSRGYTREYVMAQSERMEKHMPPQYIAEMKAVVKGLEAAGVKDIPYEEIRLGVTQAEILHFDPNSPPGCSNFACWGKWTTDGRLLHGRNLDWSIDADAQDDAVIFVWRPKGGSPFMMVGWAGGIGSVSGMNAKGITIGEMTLPTPNATFDGLPLLLTMRRVLETNTLDEAVKAIQDNPHTSGWNFILGDAKIPDGRALEVDAKRCEVYAPMDPKETQETAHWAIEDGVRRTNHPVGKDQLLDLARVFGPQLGLKIETWDQLKLVMPMLKGQNSYQRYDWLGKQITAEPGKVDIARALQMLRNGPVYNDGTLHSWVFDPKNQMAYVANAGNHPPVTATNRPFTKIDLKEWFK